MKRSVHVRFFATLASFVVTYLLFTGVVGLSVPDRQLVDVQLAQAAPARPVR